MNSLSKIVATRESILYDAAQYPCANHNDGQTFATRRSNASSTSSVVGFFIIEMSVFRGDFNRPIADFLLSATMGKQAAIQMLARLMIIWGA